MADTNIEQNGEMENTVPTIEKPAEKPKKRRQYVRSGKYAKNANLSQFQKRLNEEMQEMIKEMKKDNSGFALVVSNTQSLSIVNDFDRRKLTRALFVLAERNEQIKQSIYTVMEVLGRAE